MPFTFQISKYYLRNSRIQNTFCGIYNLNLVSSGNSYKTAPNPGKTFQKEDKFHNLNELEMLDLGERVAMEKHT